MESILIKLGLQWVFDMNMIRHLPSLLWPESHGASHHDEPAPYPKPGKTRPAEPTPPPWTTVQRHEDYELSRQGSTVRICLDRTHYGNSLTLTTMKDIISLFEELSADDSVHRIIITGRGRYFCTGMDLKEDLFTSVTERYTVLHDFFAAIDTCPKPTIAVVNGPAFGGGVGLATVCDVRIALPTAYFCLSEVKLGLCPASISKYLIREWGVSLARMAMVTGRRIRSQVLCDAGIIHALAADTGSIDNALEDLLEDMRYAAPQAAALTKTLVREAASGDDLSLDRVAEDVFEAMFAPGSESSYGIAQFKCGIKNIAWEDLRDGDRAAQIPEMTPKTSG